MTSDGHRLRQSWSTAFDDAESRFRQLLTLHSPTEWKKVSQTKEVPALNTTGKGKGRALTQPDVSDVIVHRRTEKSGEPVYRAVLEVNLPEDTLSLETWKAVLVTPELRQDWDPSVEEAQLVEMFDVSTRISRTRYTLGWPANPRDSVTISRSIHDATTFIDISTSLPRSADEPTYLRPSPPYVRSNVTLLAWCIQILQPQTPVTTEEREKRKKGVVRLRITCFSQHDLRAVWNFSSSTSVPQQLRTAVVGLFKTVASRGSRVPTLTGYGHGVTVEKLRFQLDREALSIDYAIVPDEEHDRGPDSTFGLDKLQAHKEQKRLTRAIECALPSPEGWDVRITTRASSEAVEKLPYKTIATRQTVYPHTITFRVEHAAVQEPHSVLRVKIVLELSRPSKGLRLNGLPQTITNLEERDLTRSAISPAIMQEAASMIGQSIYSVSTAETADSVASGHSRTPSRPATLVRTNTERTAAGEKSILSRVRRSYIYFSSLLQEPEAKWKRTTEARGVSVTQLDSIDPTLIVYRAEATFVGIGLWDLFSTLASPGARIYWDKQHEDAVLLEDVNELTNLWHYKTRAAWPTNGRDSIVLKTVYKSPTTIHLFSFSADDPYLFPNILPADPNIIRTQIDLRGWAIEALSPNTTSLTLLEQSDPKGWSNKASIPQQMIADVAGVGEFVIKCGGPPMVTRLLGAKTNQMRYDHERGSFRVEYEACAARRPSAPTPSSEQGEGAAAAEADGSTATAAVSVTTNANTTPTIECEIRCDVDTWASSLDIVIDPPPQTIHALRRHRLSAGGGGLWLTISHDAVLAGGEERILAIVRRGVGVGAKDKGVVMVNGAKLAVDVEELPDAEIKQLARQKRVKPARIPLDQPPVMGVIRKRREEWDSDSNNSPDKATSQQRQQQSEASTSTPAIRINTSGWMAQPAMPSPLSKWFTSAIEQATTTTRQAVAALTPAAAAASSSGEELVLSSSKPPMQCALEALAWMQDYYSRPSVSTDGWTPIADKSASLHWRSIPSLSPAISIHRGEKVIEGVSAEELASIITSDGCRAQWDESFSSATVFESFGAGCHTSFVVSKAGFPFRDRGFYVASVMAYSPVAASSSSSSSTAVGSMAAATTTGSLRRSANNTDADRPVDGRNTIFCVSASFNPESLPSSSSFATAKYNPSSLPTGRVFLDGWILETLDPYTTEKYAIPSARCVRLAAVDFAGAIPGAVNASMNVALARGVSAVDSFVKRSTGGGNGNGSAAGGGGAGSVPVPTCRLPAPAVVLARRKSEEEDEQEDSANAIASSVGAGAVAASTGPAAASAGGKVSMAWRLRWRDEERMCLGSSFIPASRTYWCILTLKLTDRVGGGGGGSNSGSGRNASEDRTPKSSRIGAYGALRAPPSPPPSGTAVPVTAPPAGGSNDTPSSEAAGEASGSSSSTLSASSFRGRDRSLSSPPGDHHLHNHKQLRSSSSVFTVRGEVRPATDLLAAELVVDTKLYPEGYEIIVHSCVQIDSGGRGTSASGTVLLPAEPTMTSASGSSGGVLPFAYVVYTMPLSPLHSAGLHADRPPRHLVRLTLPTGQYQQSTVQDPLTGEMRGARPKPSWLVDLQEKGAVVEIRVAPIASMRGVRAVGSSAGKSVVKINGVDVAVVGEKDSLTSLGREELQDERVSRMPMLSRVFGQDRPEFPKELQVAAARSESILDPGALSGAMNGQSQEMAAKDVKVATHESSDEKTLKDPEPPTSQQSNSTQSMMAKTTSSTTTAAATGLLGFLRPYPTALSLFSLPSSRSPSSSNAGTSGAAIVSKPDSSAVTREIEASNETPTSTTDTTVGTGTTAAALRPRGLQHYSYPLSTVVIVGLIAFLIGSLLRSLLSPADFIYVVTDVGEAEGVEAGWREIRRLVEVKYLFGGWDFQIAAVRRH